MDIYLILLTTGLLIGSFSSFFGVGGGILVIPCIYFLFPEIEPATAIGTSMVLVFLNTGLNLIRFLKLKYRVKSTVLLPLIASNIFGLILAKNTIQLFNPDTLKVVFGLTLLGFCLRILFFKSSDKHNSSDKEIPNIPTNKTLVVGGLGGVVSGLTGLGGGAVLIPMFIQYLKVPISKVSFLSTAVMPFGSFIGAILFLLDKKPQNIPAALIPYQVGNVNLMLSIMFFLGAMFTGKLGIILNEKVSDRRKNHLFAVLLMAISVKILSSYLF